MLAELKFTRQSFRVDLEQLVEEAIDGSWIGYCARNSTKGSEIGSVYAPNLNQRASSVMTAPPSSQSVEIVVDIDHREGVGPSKGMFTLFAET